MADNINLDRLQLALPRVSSLLFAGSALYIGFIDPCVRDSHREEKEKLAHWSTMYDKSKVIMASLALSSSLFGINAYRLTKEPLWLYGSLAAFSILPFTFLAIMGINKKLKQDEEASQKGVRNAGVVERLCQWVYRHRIRAFLALLAAGLFYAAEGTPLQVTKIKDVQVVYPVIKEGIVSRVPGIVVPLTTN